MIVFFGTVQHICKNINKNTVLSQKTNPFLQKCCTVPKKPKKQFFPVFKELPTTGLPQDLFFWNSTALLQKKTGFFGTVQHFCKKINKNTVLSQKNQSFFAKVLYCPKKTKKNNLFRSWDLAGQQDWKRLVFLVFLGQYSTFAKKDWFFRDSTALLQEN